MIVVIYHLSMVVVKRYLFMHGKKLEATQDLVAIKVMEILMVMMVGKEKVLIQLED